jgi:signal transduction histidine kinase
MVAAIQRNADNGLRLVEDLLLLSRLESSAVRTNPEPVAVAELVSSVVAATGVEAEVRVPEDVRVLADVDHLHRILTNLLVNAARHGAPPFVVDLGTDGSEVRVLVSDSGAGVPERSVDGLFVPFSPLSDVRAGGTGLGLSIVRGLARANGGDAFYERVDQRTRFGVVLPAAAS